MDNQFIRSIGVYILCLVLFYIIFLKVNLARLPYETKGIKGWITVGYFYDTTFSYPLEGNKADRLPRPANQTINYGMSWCEDVVVVLLVLFCRLMWLFVDLQQCIVLVLTSLLVASPIVDLLRFGSAVSLIRSVSGTRDFLIHCHPQKRRTNSLSKAADALGLVGCRDLYCPKAGKLFYQFRN